MFSWEGKLFCPTQECPLRAQPLKTSNLWGGDVRSKEQYDFCFNIIYYYWFLFIISFFFFGGGGGVLKEIVEYWVLLVFMQSQGTPRQAPATPGRGRNALKL